MFSTFRGILELKNETNILRKNSPFANKKCYGMTVPLVETKIYFFLCNFANKQIKKSCQFRCFIQTVANIVRALTSSPFILSQGIVPSTTKKVHFLFIGTTTSYKLSNRKYILISQYILKLLPTFLIQYYIYSNAKKQKQDKNNWVKL